MIQLALPVFIITTILIWQGITLRWLWLLAAFYVVLYIPFVMQDATYDVDRQDWFWLLIIPFTLLLIQWVMDRRSTPLDIWLIALIALCLISAQVAPFDDRGVKMVMRPLLGVLLAFYLIRLGQFDLQLTMKIVVTFGLFIVISALSTTQWTDKSSIFHDIIEALDFLPGGEPFFRRNSVNPNEIAGALTWLTPLMAGLALYRPWGKVWQASSAVVLMLMVGAIVLGQSRSAILGLLAALAFVVLITLPRRWRFIALGGIAVLLILQAMITFNVFSPDRGMTNRDRRSTNERVDYWEAAINMVADYPLTGVGMNNYRVLAATGRPYHSDEFNRDPPHTHNEILQIATDLGIPGLIVFVGLYLSAGYMTWVCWQKGDRYTRILALATFSGLLAHAVYGMTDAIPIWDRLAFIFWGMLGLIAAQHSVVQLPISNASKGVCVNN